MPQWSLGRCRTNSAGRMRTSLLCRRRERAAPGRSSIGRPPSDAGFGVHSGWLYFGEATLTVPLSTALCYSQIEPLERQAPQVVEGCTRMFFGRFRAAETLLQAWRYLWRGRFTPAAISVGRATMTADYLGLREPMFPAVQTYSDRLRVGASCTRAVAAGECALAYGGRITMSPAPGASVPC